MACLRMLGTGSFQQVVAETVSVGQATMSRKIGLFCETVIERMEAEFLPWYASLQEMNDAKASFYEMSGLSGVLLCPHSIVVIDRNRC